MKKREVNLIDFLVSNYNLLTELKSLITCNSAINFISQSQNMTKYIKLNLILRFSTFLKSGSTQHRTALIPLM